MLKCPSCKEGRLQARGWPAKARLCLVLKFTLVLWPVAALLMSKPDFYECGRCGHKKGALWV
jgi:hypothetical protein